MKSITNRAVMAKKKMYNEPKIEVVPVKAANCLCGSATLSVKTTVNPSDDFYHANTGR